MKRFQEFLNEKLQLETLYEPNTMSQPQQAPGVSPSPDQNQWANPNQPNSGGRTSSVKQTSIPGLFIIQTREGFLPVNGKNEPVERGWQHSRQWYPSFDEAFRAGQRAVRGW